MSKLQPQAKNKFKGSATFQERFRTVLQYFVRGLLFVFPVGATIVIVVAMVTWIDGLINDLFANVFGFELPGLGIIVVFFGIALFGYLLSNAFIKAVFSILDRTIAKMPFVSLIYTSLKELTEAFVGDKKKFNKPVIAEFNKEGLHRLGFITQEDLSALNLHELVAVYCPHSYNFSGNLFLVPREKVRPLDANATDVMKFILSAGVTNIQEAAQARKAAKEKAESSEGQ
jgi:uncharacterized membrane protein